MEKPIIVYFNSGFFDTDITVIKELQKSYKVFWYVILGPTEPFDASFFYHYVENSEIELRLYEIVARRRSLEYGKLICRCIKSIKELNPKLVYTCHQDLYFPLSFLLYLHKIPLVLGIHDLVLHSSYKAPLMLKMAKMVTIKLADVCVFFSKNQHEEFKRLYPHKKSRLVGMSLKDFGTPSTIVNHHLQPVQLLFFGTLQPYKGCDLLIEAFEELLDEGIDNLRLSFYGKFGDKEYMDYCQGLIKHPKFYNLHFSFIDNDDIPNIFAEHDFSIFPYRDATQSGPLMINLRYGLPIVAPAHTCFTDIYKDGSTGILYGVNQKRSTLKETLRIVSRINKDEYDELLAHCKKLKVSFSEKAIAVNYINAFDELINK